MDKYISTKEAANSIGLNEETIRRWVRERKIKNVICNSRKEGNLILYSEFIKYISTKPKYRKLAERLDIKDIRREQILAEIDRYLEIIDELKKELKELKET